MGPGGHRFLCALCAAFRNQPHQDRTLIGSWTHRNCAVNFSSGQPRGVQSITQLCFLGREASIWNWTLKRFSPEALAFKAVVVGCGLRCACTVPSGSGESGTLRRESESGRPRRAGVAFRPQWHGGAFRCLVGLSIPCLAGAARRVWSGLL